MARGRKKKKLRKIASRYRVKLIKRRRRNGSFHVEDLFKSRGLRKRKNLKSKMPSDYKRALTRAQASKIGKKALRKYRSFIGIPHPTAINLIDDGKRGTSFLVGMGTTPLVQIADGPEERHSRIKKLKQRRIVACDVKGRRIYLLKPNARGPIGKKLKFVGYVPETHYVLTKDQEAAGSFKKGKYWVHLHGKEEHGKWPKLYRDSSGNLVYGQGTYRVGDWIRR